MISEQFAAKLIVSHSNIRIPDCYTITNYKITTQCSMLNKDTRWQDKKK